MRFYRGSLDSSGQVRGISYGLGTGCLLTFAGIFLTAVIIGWPFMVFHGPAAWLAELAYAPVALVTLIVIASRKAAPKGSHHGGRRQAPVAEDPRSRGQHLPYTGPDRWKQAS